jgi:hypothetical protein
MDSYVRWVEPVLDKSNAKGGAIQWFRTYRPVPGDGWFWLGQTLDLGRALIVKENSPDANALGGVQLTSMIHSNSSGGEPTNSKGRIPNVSMFLGVLKLMAS